MTAKESNAGCRVDALTSKRWSTQANWHCFSLACFSIRATVSAAHSEGVAPSLLILPADFLTDPTPYKTVSNQVDNQDLLLLSSSPRPYLERATRIWELHLPSQDSFARNSSHKLLPPSVLAIEFFFYAMSSGSCRDSSLATLLRISDCWCIYQLHCPQGSGTSWKRWQKTEELGHRGVAHPVECSLWTWHGCWHSWTRSPRVYLHKIKPFKFSAWIEKGLTRLHYYLSSYW